MYSLSRCKRSIAFRIDRLMEGASLYINSMSINFLREREQIQLASAVNRPEVGLPGFDLA